jgi:membrane-associated phospholipid phosphatase
MTTTHAVEHAAGDTPAHRAPRVQDGHPPLVVDETPSGPAERFSERIASESPIRAFLVAIVLGYAALVTLMVLSGLLLTRVLLSISGVAGWDEGINRWLADHRDPVLEHLSWIGSTLAGGFVIPVVVVFFLVVFLARHQWRLAAFTLFVIAVESGAYRATTLVIHRDRPSVPRLESLPVDASFPSGHTAASLALYGGLVLLMVSRLRRPLVTTVSVTLVLTITAFVAWARMYRGMHHFTDCVAGVILGIGALVVTIFAVRVADASAKRRDGRLATGADTAEA